MAYQETMSAQLQRNISQNPLYYGIMAEIGRHAIEDSPNESVFWQQPFRKDLAPKGIEYYAAIGLATMHFRGWGIGQRPNHLGYGRVEIAAERGCLPDKEEEGNSQLIDNALASASAAHNKIHKRPIQYEIEINTTPPGDGTIWISEIECTRHFVRDGEMIAQDIIVFDNDFILEIGYVASIHTMIHPLIKENVGLARFPYDTPYIMLAAPTDRRKVEILNEQKAPKRTFENNKHLQDFVNATFNK